MRFIQRMGIQADTVPRYQPVPLGSIFDASVINPANVRVSLVPTKFAIGSDTESLTTVNDEANTVNELLPQSGQPLLIREVENFWYISGGNSYSKRQQLKAIGGKWNPNAKIWAIPKENITEPGLRRIFQ